MKTIQSIVHSLLCKNTYHPIVTELLQLIINDKMSGLERDKVLQSHGIRRISDMKEHTLNVILDYALISLEDGIIEDSEMLNIKMLKLFFDIKEGDFYKNNLDQQVKSIIKEQLHKIYEDGIVDYQEVLQMGELQNMFGLSYEQFEAIVKML